MPPWGEFHTLDEIQASLEGEPSFDRLQCVVDFVNLKELRQIAQKLRESS